MEHRTIVAGFGGQGLLFAGHVLAQGGMLEGRNVSWMPSYGPEMRGGTASCTVILADRPIGSPIVDEADSVIALNAPSIARFGPIVAPGGILVVDSTLTVSSARDDVEVVALPLSAIAKEAGDDRFASIVALGALVARRAVVEPTSIHQAIADVLGSGTDELVAADIGAFEVGCLRGRELAASGA
jgi:2-oxoglutarate ferredoxin oxidoreductase subunit gamma